MTKGSTPEKYKNNGSHSDIMMENMEKVQLGGVILIDSNDKIKFKKNWGAPRGACPCGGVKKISKSKLLR